MSGGLYWHCLQCGEHIPVEPTGGQERYELGDMEPCECGGTSRVVTLKQGAAYEQGLAMGLSAKDAWTRAGHGFYTNGRAVR